jgi:integrase/recombinase XerD
METFSLSGVTAAIIIDTRRPKGKGLYPVKFRVTYLRKQVYYGTGVSLSLNQWEIMPDTRKKELLEQRELIQENFDRVKKHIKDLVKGEGFSIEALNKRMSRGAKDSILAAFYNRIATLNKSGRIGSAIVFDCTLKSIEKFSRKDIKFSAITADWLKRYEKYMLDLGRSYTTVGMYMRTLRTIINEGKSQGIISNAQYPFGPDKYKIPTGIGRKMALTLSQIGEILKYPLLNDKDRMCRDLWLFSYLCNGINVNDMLKLKYSDIHDGEIRWYRLKTINSSKEKKRITAILLPEMQQIIDKWGNPEREPDNYIFSFLHERLTPLDEKNIVKNTTRMINERMKNIGKALEYGNISTYTARHSYATVLKRSGANIAFISESLGHTDLKTTENYLDSFEKEERIKNAELLTKYE